MKKAFYGLLILSAIAFGLGKFIGMNRNVANELASGMPPPAPTSLLQLCEKHDSDICDSSSRSMHYQRQVNSLNTDELNAFEKKCADLCISGKISENLLEKKLAKNPFRYETGGIFPGLNMNEAIDLAKRQFKKFTTNSVVNQKGQSRLQFPFTLPHGTTWVEEESGRILRDMIYLYSVDDNLLEVKRTWQYDEGQRPNLENTKKSLIEKFGEPTAVGPMGDRYELIWLSHGDDVPYSNGEWSDFILSTTGAWNEPEKGLPEICKTEYRIKNGLQVLKNDYCLNWVTVRFSAENGVVTSLELDIQGIATYLKMLKNVKERKDRELELSTQKINENQKNSIKPSF